VATQTKPRKFAAVPEKFLDAKQSGVTVSIASDAVAKIALE